MYQSKLYTKSKPFKFLFKMETNFSIQTHKNKFIISLSSLWKNIQVQLVYDKLHTKFEELSCNNHSKLLHPTYWMNA
jgi:hypothetical protein